jgi:CARDB
MTYVSRVSTRSCPVARVPSGFHLRRWAGRERLHRRRRCWLVGALRVFNPGLETTAVPSTVAFYLSVDDVLDENDTFLAYASVKTLELGGEELVRLNVRLPEGIDAAGLVVIAVVDFFNDVAERNETNNEAVSPPVSSRRGARVR